MYEGSILHVGQGSPTLRFLWYLPCLLDLLVSRHLLGLAGDTKNIGKFLCCLEDIFFAGVTIFPGPLSLM